MFECKSSRVRFDARTTGDLEKYAATLDRTIFDAARQANGTIVESRKGDLDEVARFDHSQFRRYRPIFVIEDMLPQDPLIWSWYEKEFAKRGLLQSSDVDRPLLLTCEELEVLEPLLAGGLSLSTLIERKLADPAFKDTTFLNFLLDGAPERKDISNASMAKTLDQLFEKMTSMHFDVPKVTP